MGKIVQMHHFYIDPVAFELGPLTVHWYGLMYVFAFGVAWLLLQQGTKHSAVLNSDLKNDLLFYSGLGVILGGRFGYALFYGLDYWLQDPLWPLRFWERGMSFHGGFLGVLVAMMWLAYRQGLPFLVLTDVIAPCVPLGLMFGRFGNFINGELWGRITDLPWGIAFQGAGPLARHPSQLYEALGEGLLLFCLLRWFKQKQKPKIGQLSGLFLMGYAFARLVVEFFREPDPQYGYLAFEWLTMGQVLSLPMILCGAWLLWKSKQQPSLYLALQPR